MSYELREDRLRVEVHDAGAGTAPQRRAHDLEALGGRGLELVDALASRWARSALLTSSSRPAPAADGAPRRAGPGP